MGGGGGLRSRYLFFDALLITKQVLTIKSTKTSLESQTSVSTLTPLGRVINAPLEIGLKSEATAGLPYVVLPQ